MLSNTPLAAGLCEQRAIISLAKVAAGITEIDDACLGFVQLWIIFQVSIKANDVETELFTGSLIAYYKESFPHRVSPIKIKKMGYLRKSDDEDLAFHCK